MIKYYKLLNDKIVESQKYNYDTVQLKKNIVHGGFVSTVFLGYAYKEPPPIFETMINDCHDEWVEVGRWCTLEEAYTEHEKALKPKVKGQFCYWAQQWHYASLFPVEPNDLEADEKVLCKLCNAKLIDRVIDLCEESGIDELLIAADYFEEIGRNVDAFLLRRKS